MYTSTSILLNVLNSVITSNRIYLETYYVKGFLLTILAGYDLFNVAQLIVKLFKPAS